MKRRLHYLLSLAMLGACGDGTENGSEGNNPSGSAPVTIKYLRHDNPPYVKADDDAFADYSMANPNVTVSSTTIRYPSLTTTLLADLKNDQLDVDLVRVVPSWVCSFADNLADVPADVLTLAQAQEIYFSAPLAGSTCDGVLKALPIEYNLEYGGVVVNMDKYEAAYPGKTPAWPDWASFIADAAGLTEYDAAGKPMANGLDIAPDWPQPVKHIFFSQILQRGGQYLTAGGEFDFNTQAAQDSLSDMVKWIATDKIMFSELIPDKNTFVTTRLAMGATGYGWNDPTVKPLSVMGYAGTWAVPNTVGQKPEGSTTRYEFQALPPMVGAEHKFVQNSGFALAVPKTSKNPKAAWALAKWLALSPANMRKWAAIAGSLPALRENGTQQAAQADPLLAKVQPLLDRGQWVGYIPAGAIETVEGALVSNYFDVVSGKKTVAQALADMQATANAAVQQHR